MIKKEFPESLTSFVSEKGQISQSKSKDEYLTYIKQLNAVKKENQEIKDELKKLNKSLDNIIKGKRKTQDKSFLNPIQESEEELQKKIESAEGLIRKYEKELSDLKKNNFSIDFSNNISMKSEIFRLQDQLRELEAENIKLIKLNSANPMKKTEKGLEKELNDLKAYRLKLEASISEEIRMIEEKRSKVKKNIEKTRPKSPLISKIRHEDGIDYEKETVRLELKIAELEKNKKCEEEAWLEKINSIRTMIDMKKSEITDMEALLKEKDRACRIKKMQIKSQQRENRIILKSKTPELSDLEEITE